METAEAQGTAASKRSTKSHVLVLEDHIIVAQALASALSIQFGIELTIAPTISEAIEYSNKHRFELAILDLELPDGNGLEVAEILAKQDPRPHLIVLAGSVNTLYCPPDLRGQLTAVISKSKAYSELISALRPILQPQGRQKSFPDPRITLTPREFDVYTLLGQGLSGKQICSELNLSAHTVESHRKRIAHKLGMSGAELIHHATLDWREQQCQFPLNQG